jgi:hypothetical protein
MLLRLEMSSSGKLELKRLLERLRDWRCVREESGAAGTGPVRLRAERSREMTREPAASQERRGHEQSGVTGV